MEKQAAQKAKGLTSEKTFETTHNQEGLPLQIKLDEKTGTALLPPNPAGKAEGGMTLQAVEDLRNTLKRLGNYDKVGDLTPGEMAARKAYHDIVPIRDDINMKVFKEAGDNVSAQELRFYRDMNKEQRDSLDRLSDLIAKKPIESWKVLLDPSKPEVIHDFYEVAPDSVKKTIKATLLDNMGDPYITASKPGQSPAFGAKAISKEWDKFPMELKQRMYTYEERTAIDGFLSVARAVENRPIPTAPGGAGAGMIGKMLSYLSRPGASALRDADKLMARVFASRPDILESLQGRLATMSVGKSKAYVLQSAQRAAEAEERLRTGNVLGLRGILGGYSPGVLPSAFGEGINKQ